MHALVLGCTLKSSPNQSSSERLGREVLTALAAHDVTGEFVRVVDYCVSFGASIDEGEGDEWPLLRQKIIDSDILVISTPIWLGQQSSVCKMVLERLDGEFSHGDDGNRYMPYGKVAGVAVVGNEDGAHHVSAEVRQALNDVGFTIPASAVTYWVGEAMGRVDYVDAGFKPKTDFTTRRMAANLAYVADMLHGTQFPAVVR